MGSLISLGMMPVVGWLSWVLLKSMLYIPWGTSQQAALLPDLCISCYLQVPDMFEFLPWLLNVIPWCETVIWNKPFPSPRSFRPWYFITVIEWIRLKMKTPKRVMMHWLYDREHTTQLSGEKDKCLLVMHPKNLATSK